LGTATLAKGIIGENGFYFWTSLDGLVGSQESAKTAAVISETALLCFFHARLLILGG
jgi:hypothetical protein